MSGFGALGVPPIILEALEAMAYKEPTPVQLVGIPPLLEGRDVILEAQTGSGKTTAFGIPAVVVGSKAPGLRVLILVPTRELARQVAEEVRALGTGSPFRAVAITGGVMEEKEDRTLAGDVRCVIATPGRLLHVMKAKRIKLDHVDFVVLDEADRMLDMGFRADIEEILEATKKRKQTALVSATIPHEVVELAKAHQKDALEVHAHSRKLPQTLTHYRLNAFRGKKEQALIALLHQEKPERAIVFMRTRDWATRISKILKAAGFAADSLQGDMSHDQRRHVFDLFSNGITKILVATDVASRGLDVPEMELVVNFDLPDEPGAYTHRAGRAARLGRVGRVVNIVLPREKDDRIHLEDESGGEWLPYKIDPKVVDAVKVPDPKDAHKQKPREGALKRAKAAGAAKAKREAAANAAPMRPGRGSAGRGGPARGPSEARGPGRGPGGPRAPARGPAAARPPARGPASARPPTRGPAAARPGAARPAAARPGAARPAAARPAARAPAAARPPPRGSGRGAGQFRDAAPEKRAPKRMRDEEKARNTPRPSPKPSDDVPETRKGRARDKR